MGILTNGPEKYLMRHNFILRYLQRDSLATLLLSTVFLAVGLWGWVSTIEVSLRAAASVSLVSGLFGLYLGRHVLLPRLEPSVRGLSRYGPLDDVLAQLQREYENPETTRFGRIYLMRNWLVACGVGVTVVHLDELVGVHHEQCGRGNWRLLLYTDDGRCETVACGSHFVAIALMPLLCLRSLWVQSGPEVAVRWETDRRRFLAEVAEKRTTLQPIRPASG